jgi:hypothetical protein
MSNPDFNKFSDPTSSKETTRTGRDPGMTERAAGAARDALSTASSLAGDVAGGARDVAADTASSIAGQVSGLVDKQIESGAARIGQMARSALRAARELDDESPQLAGLVRSLAEQVDAYAGTLKGQSAQDLFRSASNYARKQPALVFGAAALAGFVALRVLKSGSAPASRSNSNGTRSRSSTQSGTQSGAQFGAQSGTAQHSPNTQARQGGRSGQGSQGGTRQTHGL